jgi:hypothetical protein
LKLARPVAPAEDRFEQIQIDQIILSEREKQTGHSSEIVCSEHEMLNELLAEDEEKRLDQAV